MIKRGLFLFRYAYRNITKHFFRSLTLFLSITMLSFIVLVALSIGDAFTRGYSLYKYLDNENVDVEITFDGNSKNHIVLSDKIQQLSAYIDYYGSFFNMESTSNINGQIEYVNIISGTSEELNPFIESDLKHIQFDEIVINNEFAKNYNLNIGDNFNILIGNNNVDYKIVDIINTKGIFNENSVFIQKNAFIKKISDDSFDIDLNFLGNEIYLSNKICINLKDNVNEVEFINILKSEDFYPNSIVRNPSDIADYQPVLDIAVGIMYAAIAIFIAAMIFVLVSIINLRIMNMRNEIGIIETIGENKKYMFKVLSIEMMLFSFFGIILAWLLCKNIYRIEFLIFSDYPDYNYPFTVGQILLTLLVICVVSILCIFISYNKFKKVETIELSKSKRFEHVWPIKKLAIVNIVCLILWSLKFILKPYIHIKIYSLYTVIIVIIFSITMVSLLLKIILSTFKFKTIFKYSIGNNLSYNLTKHNSLRILVICLFGIVAAFCVIETINKEINKVETNLNIDYAIINVSEFDDEQAQKMLEFDAVDMVGKANFLQKLVTIDGKHAFEIVFSCETEKTIHFMNFELPEDVAEEFKNPNKNYIVVTNEFLKANDMEVGDFLSFKIVDEYMSYEIIASCNVGFQLFAYTNDCYNDKIGYNSVLVSTNEENVKSLREFNIFMRENYSSNMVYILNVAEAINNIFSRGKMALNVVYVILVIIIACFIISIINNTILIFKEIKTELAILQILGISPSDLNKMVIYEMVVSYSVILLPLCFMTYTFFEIFGGFSLLFGYYVDLQASFITILLGIICGMACFGLSYIYYFVGLKKIDVCYELKK